MSKRAAIYVRISNDKAGQGLGVTRQEEACRKLADQLGCTSVKVYQDNDISAYSGKKRPGYLAMVEDITNGQIDIVIAWSPDRLTRQMKELESLIDTVTEAGIEIQTLQGGRVDLNTPGGRMNARMMGTVARFESELKAERVREARQQQARQGRNGGGRRPYGFELDRETIIPEEAKVIRRVADVVLLSNFGTKNGPSLASIARELQIEGIPTADGGKWNAPAVRDMIVRPRNAALAVHRPINGKKVRKVYTKADVIGTLPFEPIIPAEELWLIVGKLTDPNRRTNKAGVAPRWLGSGVYRCPCGSVVRVTGSAQKRERPVYTCPVRGEGTHASCPQAELDELVEATAVVWLATYASDYIKPRPGVDVAAIRAKISTLKAQKAEVGRDRDDGLIERGEYVDRVKRINVQIEDFERQLIDAAETSTLGEFAGVESEADALRVWKGLGITRQREIVKTVMSVTLKPTGRGWRGTIDQRVSIEPVRPE